MTSFYSGMPEEGIAAIDDSNVSLAQIDAETLEELLSALGGEDPALTIKADFVTDRNGYPSFYRLAPMLEPTTVRETYRDGNDPIFVTVRRSYIIDRNSVAAKLLIGNAEGVQEVKRLAKLAEAQDRLEEAQAEVDRLSRKPGA